MAKKVPELRDLKFSEIEEVFQNWRQQAEASEDLHNLWNCLFNDLQLKANQHPASPLSS